MLGVGQLVGEIGWNAAGLWDDWGVPGLNGLAGWSDDYGWGGWLGNHG